MNNKTITYEQLLAGALLKFNIVNTLDIVLLIGGINYYGYGNIKYIDKEPEIINNYTTYKDSYISIKNEYTKDETTKSNIKKLLNKLQGSTVKSYLNTIDEEDFVLKKLSISTNKNIYTKRELEIIKTLINQGMINVKSHKDTSNQTKNEIYLTRYGKTRLFMNQYKNQIINFITKIESYGYDSDIIFEYLLTQDLESNINDILSVDSLIRFSNMYNIDIQKSHKLTKNNK